MATVITKHGTMFETYNFTCTKCGCEFTCEEQDLNHNLNEVYCPEMKCNNKMKIKKETWIGIIPLLKSIFCKYYA